MTPKTKRVVATVLSIGLLGFELVNLALHVRDVLEELDGRDESWISFEADELGPPEWGLMDGEWVKRTGVEAHDRVRNDLRGLDGACISALFAPGEPSTHPCGLGVGHPGDHSCAVLGCETEWTA